MSENILEVKLREEKERFREREEKIRLKLIRDTISNYNKKDDKKGG